MTSCSIKVVATLDIPSELQCLDQLEWMLLASCMAFMKIQAAAGGKQKRLRAASAMYPQILVLFSLI